MIERMREEVEANLDLILRAYIDALVANIPAGTPDHAKRLQAAREMLDRVLGRPDVSTEVEREARRVARQEALGLTFGRTLGDLPDE